MGPRRKHPGRQLTEQGAIQPDNWAGGPSMQHVGCYPPLPAPSKTSSLESSVKWWRLRLAGRIDAILQVPTTNSTPCSRLSKCCQRRATVVDARLACYPCAFDPRRLQETNQPNQPTPRLSVSQRRGQDATTRPRCFAAIIVVLASQSV